MKLHVNSCFSPKKLLIRPQRTIVAAKQTCRTDRKCHPQRNHTVNCHWKYYLIMTVLIHGLIREQSNFVCSILQKIKCTTSFQVHYISEVVIFLFRRVAPLIHACISNRFKGVVWKLESHHFCNISACLPLYHFGGFKNALPSCPIFSELFCCVFVVFFFLLFAGA